MSRRNYSQPAGSTPYQRRYAGFRGVDFTSNPMNVDFTRSPYAENVIVDSAGVVHKRPRHAMYANAKDNAEVYGMGLYKPPEKISSHYVLVIHAGNRLYIDDTYLGEIVFVSNIAATPSVMFQHDDKFYVMNGREYYQISYDDATAALVCRPVSSVATAVETQIAGYYRAEEETSVDENQNQQTTINYEWQFGEKGERNLLTGRRINTFCGDGIHGTFYLDRANFAVYKVEMYRYIPDAGAAATGATVTITSGTNIRKKPSMSGEIITKTTTTQTCSTTGLTGNWYQILWQGETAYVHKSRCTPSGDPATITTDADGWEEMTSGWSVSEDSGKKCTKIVFDSQHIPPVHPMGNGLPNIRVTGSVTEVKELNEIIAANTGDFRLIVGAAGLITSITPKVNGTALTEGFTVTYDGRYVTEVLIDHVNAGDTVSFVARKEAYPDKGTIEKCNKFGCFGEYNNDRFFFTGNPDHLNRDWYTEPSDPTCVLENSYTDIGNRDAGIAGYLNYQSDMLIIKHDSNGNNLFRRTASTDGDLTIFPVKAYKGRGVTSDKAIANIKGECVFLTAEGVFQFISSDLGSKYGTKEMSYTIRKKLLQENLSEGVMGVWGDWLLLSFQSTGHCYVADTTQLTAPSTSGGNGWEWFYWTGCPFENMLYSIEGEQLLFSKAGGFLCYTDSNTSEWQDVVYLDDGSDGNETDDSVVSTYTATWTTPQDAMEDPARYKFLERRGGIMHFEPFLQNLKYAMVADGNNVIMKRDEFIESDLDTERDYDFIEIHASPEVPDVCINRRLPRFKYLQFVFQNDDPETDGIGLLSLEFQYRFGRYII